jgi:hypothetical protein
MRLQSPLRPVSPSTVGINRMHYDMAGADWLQVRMGVLTFELNGWGRDMWWE